MKFIFSLFLLILAFCFSSAVPIVQFWDAVDAITNNNTPALEKEKELIPCMVGGDGPEGINIVSLGYKLNSQKELTLNDARKLYVEIVEGLLKQLNQEKIIRPYVVNYPLRSANIEIVVFSDKGINFVSSFRGNIIYEKRRNGNIESVYEEPYEEAKKLVEKELGYVPAFMPKEEPSFKNMRTDIQVTFYNYEGPEFGVLPRKAIDRFGRNLALKKNLQFIKIGGREFVDNKEIGWSIHFASDQKRTIRQMRPIVLDMIDAFYTTINEDPVFKNYLIEEIHTNFDAKVDTHLGLNRLGFTIAFWDESVERPKRPYLAQIRVANEQIYYYYTDPETQALKDPYIETFDQARAKLNSTLPAS